MMTPLVTIYIPSHNYGRFLERSIESVVSQTYKNWELFVIDDGSSDSTLQIAMSYEEKVQNKYEVIRNEVATGLQKIANKVLSVAEGKYIFRLDADDWLDESALNVLVTKIEENKKAGMVYGGFHYTDVKGNYLSSEIFDSYIHEPGTTYLPPHGACTLIKTRILKSVGGYYTDINAQDGWDAWLKIAKAHPVISVSTPIFFYRQHPESLTTNSDRVLSARSKLISRAQIKNKGDYNPNVLAVIPLREDNVGWSTRKLRGKSLVSKVLETVENTTSVDTIIVACKKKKPDNSMPIDITPHKKAIFFDRNVDGGETHLPVEIILKESISFYHKDFGQKPDIFLFLSAHVPFRTAKNIEDAISTLLSSGFDSVISAEKIREPVFAHSDNGLELLNAGRLNNLDKQNEQLYSFNSSIVCGWVDNLENNTVFGDRINFIEFPQHSLSKINNEKDWDNLSSQIEQGLIEW